MRLSFRLKLLIALLFAGSDFVLIWSLPRLGISYGRAELPFLLLLCARLGVLLLFVSADGMAQRRGGTGVIRIVGAMHLAAQLAVSLAAADAFCIEPFDLGTTELRLNGPALAPGRPLRILHLTDLHMERITGREQDLLRRTHELQPNLILLTGDYLNVDFHDDPMARRDAHRILAGLQAPLGVYAISGNTDYGEMLEEIFSDTDIVLLEDTALRIELPGADLYLIGIRYRSKGTIFEAAETVAMFLAEAPPDSYRILLYHSPDLAEAAPSGEIDLYLAGHTHGGQIRLPFYGAMITYSNFGKKYEMGEYRIGGTVLYVSRGIGMEGKNWPRARFLCPPEIELLLLDPSYP